jgi:endonuclease/exonuclease/phosphatase family metal-dependent hydrolase
MILDKAKEFKDLPVVFTGDLNFLEISLGYKDITADVLKDTKVLAKDTMNSQTFHNADPNAFRDYVLDYILINDNFKALKYEVVKKRYENRYISDHHAVITKIEVVS